MANTINNTQLISGSKTRIIYFTLSSDGTQETNLVVYDSSSYPGIDSLNCSIRQMWCSVSTGSTTMTAALKYDATTPVLAMPIPCVYGPSWYLDFRDIGGLKNTSGVGKTGDITLTTTGMASGNLMSFVIEVDPN